MSKSHSVKAGTVKAMREQSTGDSTLSVLESHTTPAVATAPAKTSAPKVITGQYLLDTFVNDRGESTKMQIVKTMVGTVDVASFKSALKDMVAAAAKIDIANGIPEKEVTKRGSNWKTAANARAVIQNLYGALRFAPEEFAAQGYKDGTGYQASARMAITALKTKAIGWDGVQARSQELKDKAALFKAEEAALREVQKAMPRQPDESLIEYNTRTLALVHDKLEALAQEKHQKAIDEAVSKLLEKHGYDDAKLIAQGILAAHEALV